MQEVERFQDVTVVGCVDVDGQSRRWRRQGGCWGGVLFPAGAQQGRPLSGVSWPRCLDAPNTTLTVFQLHKLMPKHSFDKQSIKDILSVGLIFISWHRLINQYCFYWHWHGAHFLQLDNNSKRFQSNQVRVLRLTRWEFSPFAVIDSRIWSCVPCDVKSARDE